MVQLEAAAARVRWPTGQPRNGYLTKSYAISKASQHCQSGGVKDPILAPLSLGHQLGFEVSMSDGSWTPLPLMKSVSKEGSTLFLHYIHTKQYILYMRSFQFVQFSASGYEDFQEIRDPQAISKPVSKT